MSKKKKSVNAHAKLLEEGLQGLESGGSVLFWVFPAAVLLAFEPLRLNKFEKPSSIATEFSSTTKT